MNPIIITGVDRRGAVVMRPEHNRTLIDGRLHDIVLIEDLEAFAFERSATVAYPVQPNGYATCAGDGYAYAAWWPGNRTTS